LPFLAFHFPQLSLKERTMLGNSQVPDKALLKKINQRVLRAGMSSQSKVTVTIRNGHVTLSGTLQYANQRRTLLRVASSIEGVRSVTDQMQLKTLEKRR